MEGPASLTIDRRFVGPPGMAHGGYLGGRLAALISNGPAAEVRLRAPTPLETPLTVDLSDASRLRLLAGDKLCAECSPCELELELESVPLVTYEQAEQAGAEALDWALDHLPVDARRDLEAREEQDRCFGCLPRPDGLRLLPGRVGSTNVTATAVHVPRDLMAQDMVPAELVWATVDCPSMWACKLLAHEEDEEGFLARPTFTGTLSVKVRRLPHADERLYVQAWRLGREGRKLFGAAVLVGGGDEILAEGQQTAILA